MIKNIIIVFSVFALISSCATKEEEKEADTTAPTSTTSSDFINSGDGNTAKLTVTLALSATDDVGVVAYYAEAYDGSTSATAPSSSSTSWVDVTSAVSYSSDNVSYTLTTTSGNYEYIPRGYRCVTSINRPICRIWCMDCICYFVLSI